jgi:biotin carboxylase
MQVPAARAIKELGYQLIVSDVSDECACRSLADYFIQADTFDPAANLAMIDSCPARDRISCVFTCAADCHETVAILARALNCHGINPDISHSCRQKHLTREILTKAGLRQPRFKVVKSFAEAKHFVAELGGEAVLKSTDNSASRGFSKIDGDQPLSEALFELALENGTTGLVLVEEMLRPITTECAEQSVETLWTNGEMVWLNWVDRLFRKDLELFGQQTPLSYKGIGWGVEIGHINPAQHDESLRQMVEDEIRRGGLAIGMATQKGIHILKADIMLTEEGPVIIEMTPRLSGGWDCGYSTPARHGDFITGALQAALGETDIDKLIAGYFKPDPDLVSAVLTEVPPNASNCIGRKFAGGVGVSVPQALEAATQALNSQHFF